jgi:hypothetical protein
MSCHSAIAGLRPDITPDKSVYWGLSPRVDVEATTLILHVARIRLQSVEDLWLPRAEHSMWVALMPA